MYDQQIQAGLDAMSAAVPPDATEAQRVVLAKCRALLRGYHERWKSDGYQPQAVEQTVAAELYNPETHAKSRTFSIAGKLDVIATKHGQRFIIDHKTTTSDLAPDSNYWAQLVIEAQPSHYMLLEWQNGRKVDSAVWDAIRKPTIGVLAVPILDDDGLKIVLDANGERVRNQSKQVPHLDADGKKIVLDANGERVPGTKAGTWKQTADASQGQTLKTTEVLGTWRQTGDTVLGYVVQTRPMTPEEVEERIFNDIGERPEWYFARRAVPRLDAEIVEHAEELWGHSQDLIAARRSGRWPRNSGACMLYNSPCKFLGLCSGHDTPDSDRWQKKEAVHAELPVEGDGRNVLTNSRIKCFQTCRRKHFYEYELGIVRYDDEEKEALFFGSLLHLGLEIWWKHLMQGETN